MKKTIQKLLSVMIALTLVLVLGMTSFAATKTITIVKSSNDTATHKYDAYQIFTGTIDTDSSGNTVLKDLQIGDGVNLDALLAALYDDPSGKGINDAASAIEELNVKGDTVSEAEMAAVIDGCVTSPSFSVESADTSVTLDVEAPGYYFIKDTITSGNNGAVSNFILEVIEDDTTVNLKTDVPSIDKKISPDLTCNAVNIGDEITYVITSKVPDTSEYPTYDFSINDTLSAGLSFEGITSVVVGSDTVNEGDYTLTSSEHSFVLTLDDIQSYSAGDDITVTYTATLNEHCVITTGANTNTVYLEYSNDPNDASSTGRTPDIITKTYTTGIAIDKVDQEGNPLTEAKFTLEGSNVTLNTLIITDDGHTAEAVPVSGNSYEATVDANGHIEFLGLMPGTYTLHEEAPSGYNSASDITFTIGCTFDTNGDPTWTYSDGTSTDVDPDSPVLHTLVVENTKASNLPSTGGIGTTIFYIAGGTLLAGGIILLVTKKRMSADKEK